MLFLLFGIGTKRKLLGAGGVRTCPRCHNTTQWTRVRQFRQFSAFFIPLMRWKRQEFEVCGICGTAVSA